MELKHLVGEHKLSGICLVNLIDKYSEDYQKIYFTLNNITYCVTEDPDDGFRSYMDDIVMTTDNISMTTFPPINVVCTHLSEIKEDNTSRTTMTNILVISDKANGLPILRVGTENTNDYYPYTVCEYTPQNMVYNVLVGKSLYG